MRSLLKSLIGLSVLFWLTAGGFAIADDWTAVRLRGAVFELVSGEWHPLERGAVVSDDRVIRSAPNGRAVFQRGAETIELGPDTAIQIHDRDGQHYTLVQQYFGEVTVDAEERNVQHFEVHTRFLAAVVKGTQFTVTAGDTGAEVQVLRGVVQVSDSHYNTSVPVSAGHSAGVTGIIAEDGTVIGSGPATDGGPGQAELRVDGEVVAEIGPPDHSNAGGNGVGNAHGLNGGNGVGNAYGLNGGNGVGNGHGVGGGTGNDGTGNNGHNGVGGGTGNDGTGNNGHNGVGGGTGNNGHNGVGGGTGNGGGGNGGGHGNR